MARILLTGSTGYIGRRLIEPLLEEGHFLICPVRDKRRFDYEDFSDEQLERILVLEADFSEDGDFDQLPRDLDAAYYLIHSMSDKTEDFRKKESVTAENFSSYIGKSTARQVIYLSGIVNDDELSDHLASRYDVERILEKSQIPTTTLRAGIIIGSGSASFEIIRDLVEKLPVMIAPRWLSSRCQPISLGNVIQYLIGVLFKEECYQNSFDIAGPEILTYKGMLHGYAKVRNLRRSIIVVPVLTPHLSSLWMFFVTSTSYYLARHLVESMKNEVIARDNEIDQYVKVDNKYGYEEALERALMRVDSGGVTSSWKDSVETNFNKHFVGQKSTPKYGVFKDKKVVEINKDVASAMARIWQIGGENGWYYGNWLWGIRGLMDKVVGGVGLRRGRRSQSDLKMGDALDFWRVLYVNRDERKLLLFAEMKLPGDAWLEFHIRSESGKHLLYQTATFRPKGLWGRMYWWLVSPFHMFIFRGMASRIANGW